MYYYLRDFMLTNLGAALEYFWLQAIAFMCTSINYCKQKTLRMELPILVNSADAKKFVNTDCHKAFRLSVILVHVFEDMTNNLFV